MRDLIVCVFVFVSFTLHAIVWPVIMVADATCVCVRRGRGLKYIILAKSLP